MEEAKVMETVEEIKDEVMDQEVKIPEAIKNSDAWSIVMIVLAVLGIIFFPAFVAAVIVYFVKLRPKKEKASKEEPIQETETVVEAEEKTE